MQYDGIKSGDDLEIPGGCVRLSCRNFDHPSAIGMRGSLAFKSVKLQLNGSACRGRAKDPDRTVALQDHVIGKHFSYAQLCIQFIMKEEQEEQPGKPAQQEK
jgi:hypothetical protein